MHAKHKVSKAENHSISKLARHAIAKSMLDISELNISCSNGGQIDLTGKVRTPTGYVGSLNVRQEFDALTEMVRNTRGVRHISRDSVLML